MQTELDPPVNTHPHLHFLNVTVTAVSWKQADVETFYVN